MYKTASFHNQVKLPLNKVKYEWKDGWRELATEYWSVSYKLASENGNILVFSAEYDSGDYSSFAPHTIKSRITVRADEQNIECDSLVEYWRWDAEDIAKAEESGRAYPEWKNPNDPYVELLFFEEYLQDMRMDYQGPLPKEKKSAFLKNRIVPILIAAGIGLFLAFLKTKL